MNKLTQLRLLKGVTLRATREAMKQIKSRSGFKSVNDVPEEKLNDILSIYEDDTIFVQVGLSDVKKAFREDPYEFIMSKLESNYNNIITTSYTQSFRESRIYHKQFSKPEVGMFSRLFLEDADYRTDDAVHSMLVKGDYRFDRYNHHSSFSKESCSRKLDEENVLCMNIGTHRLVCPVFHYLEQLCEVPHVNNKHYQGVIYHNETEFDRFVQTNFEYSSILTTVWNYKKVRKELEKNGALRNYSEGGLRIYVYRYNDVKEHLKPILQEDPYYLIV